MKGKVMLVLATAVAVVALLRIAGFAGADPLVKRSLAGSAPTIISYQGKLTVDGTPYHGTGYLKFAVVDAAATTTYWSNDGTSSGGGEPTHAISLPVENGLFDVLLGDPSLTNMTEPMTASVFAGSERYLRVWFSADNVTFTALSPSKRVAAVPYALLAQAAGNADTVDGEHASAFADASHSHAPGDITPQGAGSNLDADTLDGSHASVLVPPGTVVAHAGSTPPNGWLLCNGAAVSRSQYAALFAAIGTAHGSGNGATTFNLPDYRGRFLRGVDGGVGRDPDRATRSAPNPGGNAGDNVGSVQGDELRAHRHSYTKENARYQRASSSSGEWFWADSASGDTTYTGGNETRPVNAYVIWIIKY